MASFPPVSCIGYQAYLEDLDLAAPLEVLHFFQFVYGIDYVVLCYPIFFAGPDETGKNRANGQKRVRIIKTAGSQHKSSTLVPLPAKR